MLNAFGDRNEPAVEVVALDDTENSGTGAKAPRNEGCETNIPVVALPVRPRIWHNSARGRICAVGV